MKSHSLAVLALIGSSASASAGSLELAGYLGPAVPFYDQSFRYDPGPATLRIPGVTIRQEGVFRMEGSGGLAVGLGATWYFAWLVGLEGRLDTAAVDAEITGARYNVTVDLPRPLPPLSTDLDLGSGTADVERLRPLSLNLKLKTPGPVRLSASAGLSYLPEIVFTATQRIGLGATGFDARGRIDVATLRLRAEAVPDDEGGGARLGANVGAGLQLSVLPRVALVAEGRYFVFKKHRLRWGPADEPPRSALERALLDATLDRLEPVEFNPTFFQLTAGVTLTF